MAAFIDLWKNHPARQNPAVIAPCTDSKGNPYYPNQCAIRLSVCLIASGEDMTTFRGACCWHGHKRDHVLRVEQLARWLDSESATFVPWAEVKVRADVGPLAHQDYAGRQGILMCRNFWGTSNQGDHIDLWDGSRMARGHPDYIDQAAEVWFWEL